MILSTFTTRDMRMDRGNRTTVVASSLLALTFVASAVLVFSDQTSIAQTPGLQMPASMAENAETAEKSNDQFVSNSAVAQADLTQPVDSDLDESTIQQVAGTSTRYNTKPSGGLLKALTGTANRATTQKQARPVAKSSGSSDGLFGGLFGEQSSSRSQISDSGSPKKEYRVVTPVPNENRAPANWDGIPYHQAQSTKAKSTITPIRDPGIEQRVVSQPARTSSAPVTRSIPVPRAETASSGSLRRSVPVTSQDKDYRPAVVTRPVTPIPRSTTSTQSASVRTSPSIDRSILSENTSSRRSGRQTIDALDASEIAAAAKPSQPKRETTIPATEAPKVARREIPSSTSTPSDSSKTTPKTIAGSDLAVKQTVPSKDVPVVKAKPKAAEVMAQTTPQASSSTSAGEQGTVTSLLAVPRIAASLAQSKPQTDSERYTTPAAPGEASLDSAEKEPLGSVPATPYAASTPNMSDIPSEFQPRGSVVSNRTKGESGSDVYIPASSMPSADFAPQVTAPQSPTLVLEPSDNRVAQAPAATDQLRTLAPLHSSTNVSTNAASANQLGVTATPPSLQLDEIAGKAGTTPSEPKLPAIPLTSIPASATAKVEDATRAIQPNQSTAASELPGIRVATFGPSQIMIRQSHPYEVRIENRGSVDASGLVVRANIPSWAEVLGSSASRGDVEATAQSGQVERLVWKIDSLPAGATERMFVRLKAVRSGSHDMDVDWTLAPQKSVSTVYVQEPKIAVSIDGPDEVTYGESRTYKVRISNPGDGIAPNVMFTLSPNSATPQTQRIGDIPAGKEASIDIELSAQDLGDLSINGLASGDLELRAEATKTIRVASAKLQATLSGPQVKYQNTESTYHLEIRNAGTAASEKVIASLRLPVGVKYLGGIEPASLRADLLTWTIDSLQPGAVRDYQFKCNMNATGEQMFAFECRGTAAGQADVAIATRVEAIADLVLTVNDPPAPAPVGSDVTYEIVVRNRGSKEATEVTAVAQFSHGIEPQRVEGQTGKIATGQVLFDVIARIAPGEERVMRVIAKAETDGHHRFRTEIRSGETMLVAEEATHYMSPQSERVSQQSAEKPIR
jgi:Domain of unknown function DUF11